MHKKVEGGRMKRDMLGISNTKGSKIGKGGIDKHGKVGKRVSQHVYEFQERQKRGVEGKKNEN